MSSRVAGPWLLRPKVLLVAALFVGFAGLLVMALRGELRRDEAELRSTVTGLVEVQPLLMASGSADIVRTDRLALLLVDPVTRHAVALKIETPLVPPQNISIGQVNAQDGKPLTGSYYLVGITDKDGEIFKPAPGEVYGRTAEPVTLGTQQVRLVLDQPFRGTLFNEPAAVAAGGPMGAAPMGGPAAGGPFMQGAEQGPPERTVRGTVRASPELAAQVAPTDRLIVMLFDPRQGRPAAIRIVPGAKLPQKFSISLPPGADLKQGYSLRILTDKDESPFHAAPGEIVGRSPGLVRPGGAPVDLVMDQPYVR